MDTQKPLIIGLYSTAPQSGKTTVAGFLEDVYDYEPLSFATPIKSMLCMLLWSAGISPKTTDELASTSKEAKIPVLGGKSYRELSQTLGTEWGRNQVDNNLWAQITLKKAATFPLTVIDDVRFDNEYWGIRSLGGKVFKIHRPTAKRPNSHISEGALDNYYFDEHINNDGHIVDLKAQIVRLMAKYQ